MSDTNGLSYLQKTTMEHLDETFRSYNCLSIITIINLIIILLLASSSYKYQLKVFHLSQSDSKSPQVSRTLLSILIGVNNAVFQPLPILPLPIVFFQAFEDRSKQTANDWYHYRSHVLMFFSPLTRKLVNKNISNKVLPKLISTGVTTNILVHACAWHVYHVTEAF